jgi:transcription initiation factor TFIIE subunit alpha
LRTDYDQYYASLAASSAASALDTPGASFSDDFGDFGDDDDDDRKPNIEYLDSLNEYRKRSRSREDVGPAGKKTPRLEETYSYGFGKANGKPYGLAASPMDLPPESVITDDGGPEDDPTVYGSLPFN